MPRFYNIQCHPENEDKPLKIKWLLSLCVQRRIVKAKSRWGYNRGYEFPEWGYFHFGHIRSTSMALTDTEIRRSKPTDKPYKVSDSGGLHLLITPTGGKLWRWKYRFDGAEKLMALGDIRRFLWPTLVNDVMQPEGSWPMASTQWPNGWPRRRPSRW